MFMEVFSNMNSFAERLNEALKLRGLSQAELSRRTGIGRNSISDYLKSKYEAKQDNLFLLANALDVNEAWLMGLDAEMEKNSIDSIFKQLNKERQNNVMNFAKAQLTEQNKVITLNNDTSNDIPTLAAHRVDENHISSPEEIENLHSFLDEIDKKYDEKHKDR